MNKEIASSLMHHIDDGELDVGHAPDTIKQWFETLGLEMSFLRFMQWSWPQNECQIGPVSILGAQLIPNQDNIQSYLKDKLLPVGSGPNGDTFVVDFSTESCPVGFVTHEEFYGEGSPRKFFRPAARSIESFLYRVAEGRYFPCDYFVTGDFNDFLRDEATHEAFPPYERKAQNPKKANI
ncbi:MAG: hypothetical protein ACK5OC_18685 [Pirellula sp.]|jgi:hypothetical protein